MRLKPEIKKYSKETVLSMFPGVDIYLFGSRVDNNANGGDIDILILSEQKLEKRNLGYSVWNSIKNLVGKK